MPGEHLTNEEFFTKLNTLLESHRGGENGHGSVYLSQKRMSYTTENSPPSPTKIPDDPLWDTHPENPLPLILRAYTSKSDKKKGGSENRAKTKISTVVQPDQLDTFYARYAEVCKAGMTALKKRDKKKKKKDKAKKRKGGEGEKKG